MEYAADGLGSLKCAAWHYSSLGVGLASVESAVTSWEIIPIRYGIMGKKSFWVLMVLYTRDFNLNSNRENQYDCLDIPLKNKSCHDANLVVISGTRIWNYDNIQYHHWQSWHHDDSWFSVFLWFVELLILACMWCAQFPKITHDKVSCDFRCSNFLYYHNA